MMFVSSLQTYVIDINGLRNSWAVLKIKIENAMPFPSIVLKRNTDRNAV